MTFHNFLKAVDFFAVGNHTKGYLNPVLSLNQKEILDCVHANRFNIIYKNRKDGVTTALSLYLLWIVISKPGTSVAFLSHQNATSRESFRQLINWNLGNLNLNLNEGTHNTRRTILNNGSDIRYFNLSDTSLTGGMFDIVVFEDFFSSSAHHLDNKKILNQCFFALSVNGKMIISSMVSNMVDEDYRLFRSLGFTEVYGSFFNGKRKVIVEKFKGSGAKNLKLQLLH